MRVAVVGMGRMGAAMARRLAAESNHQLIVFNRGRDKALEIAPEIGADVAESARAAAAAAEVVLVSLADDAAVLATYRGDDGLLAGLREGIVVCDTSTVAPATMRALDPDVSDRGARLLDTPVSGSVPVVQQGQLTVMVGGDAEALAVAQPVLDAISKQTFHLGAVGAGSTMKLVVNSMVAALNSAVSEALVLAERAGLDRALTYDVLMSSAAGAPYVHYKQAAFLEPEAAAVAFNLALVAKDQGLIQQLAEQVGAPMPQADANRGSVAAAVDAGWGDADMSALASYLRTLPDDDG
jgi:3-hydroxyisobutyrate dehydrogenase-like beta-hydroxyacid dehydrogenase